MSDSLAASLERLHAAHQSEPEHPSLPSTTLESRRTRRESFCGPQGGIAESRDSKVPPAVVTEPSWTAAAQGGLPHLDDEQRGKPRIALGVRAALAGVFALLALGGGVVSAHLLTASAGPIPIAISTLPDGEPHEPPAPTSDAATSVATGATETPALTTALVVVHVAGAVTNPGIVELPAGARVAQAVEQAGGATSEADLSAINLARVIVDGEQILIPVIGQAVNPLAEQPAAAPQLDLSQQRDEAGRINLNQANSTLLQELPGIGPALAGRIINYRDQVGGFTNIEQLQEVSGIGPAVMNNVRDQVSAN